MSPYGITKPGNSKCIILNETEFRIKKVIDICPQSTDDQVVNDYVSRGLSDLRLSVDNISHKLVNKWVSK